MTTLETGFVKLNVVGASLPIIITFSVISNHSLNTVRMLKV